MKPDKLYCGKCGIDLNAENRKFDDYPRECPECGRIFDAKKVSKVANYGFFPGGGQIVNGNLFKAMGVLTITGLAFTTGLYSVSGLWSGIIIGLIASSIVVVSADMAAIERATRNAGYSKVPPPERTVYNTTKP